jgi:hypothetical protein
MKKILTLAVGATMLMGAGMGVANAQGAASGPFADVPTDHWAYTSVEKLRDAGIVIGYPDQTYGGKRAMTRYEFATAIARLLALIPAKVDMSAYALKSDIPTAQGPIDLSQYAKQSDLDALKADLYNKLSQDQAALAALTALVNQFEPELKQMGIDIDNVKASLAGIQARLAAVEAEQQRVRITGDASFIGRSNMDDKNNSTLPIDQDGNQVGTLGNKSLTNTPEVYNDILLNIYGRVSDNSQAIIKIDAGNYLPWLGSATAQDRSTATGLGINDEPNIEQFNIYEAYFTAPVSLGPTSGAEVKIGRFGTQFTKYVWKAVNPDSYASRPETSSGDIIGDGVGLNFGWAGAHFQTFAEKNVVPDLVVGGGPGATRSGIFRPGSNPAVPGGENYLLNPLDQSAGARITIGNPDNLVVGISGIFARINPSDVSAFDPTSGKSINTVGVIGLDVQGLLPGFHKSGLTVDASVAENATGTDSQYGNVNSNKDNQAWDAQLGWASGAFAIKGGYQQVYTDFAAPGYWGRVGSWTNPVNIKGGIVSGSYAISHSLKLVGEGNFYQGIENTPDSPIQKNDHLNRYQVGAQYGMAHQYNVDLGYEWVQWQLKDDSPYQNTVGGLLNAGSPVEQYITIGLGHDFSQNASLKLLYQILDYSDKGTGFGNGGSPFNGDSGGGIALTQFTMKF